MSATHHPPASAEKGTLYVVATPLGNLRDITQRALDILGGVDAVAAEDTRDTRQLLAHFGLATPCFALHQHNEAAAAQRVLERLRAGEAIALVSDAGTPAISDPGGLLVAAVRAAGMPVVPVPGPAALTTALSVAGLGETGFVFGGFLPVKSGPRREAIKRLARCALPIVLYEAPHRLSECVADLSTVLGDEAKLRIARELTKRFEEVHLCRLSEAPAWFAADANRMRGEFVLIVEPPATKAQTAPILAPEELLGLLLGELPPTRAAKLAARLTGEARQVLYARAMALKGGEHGTEGSAAGE